MTNEIFTDEEKLALKSTNKKFKYIARDEDGDLYLYETEPFKDENVFDTNDGDCRFVCDKCFSNIFFRNVTWKNSPIKYR